MKPEKKNCLQHSFYKADKGTHFQQLYSTTATGKRNIISTDGSHFPLLRAPLLRSGGLLNIAMDCVSF